MDDTLRKFVRKRTNLTAAWQAVRANSRFSTSPYVKDEASSFSGEEQRRIASISARIQHGSYKFSASRGVAISKKDKPGKVRPIVISKVEDRIVQRCVLDALTSNPHMRKQAFQPLSFGGIPKQNGKDYAGVPAAVEQLIASVASGATHVMIADIEGFFTKISKSSCLTLVSRFTDDGPFLDLLGKAISVDLENARALWKHKDQFPYGDIGVAQGNCLSPFLGNLLLSDFDQQMNAGDCQCIRYIDDIIIAAPSGKAASARFRKAKRLLASYGMDFAADKSSKAPIPVGNAFEYLGIEFSASGLRPAKKARRSIVARCQEVAARSLQHMNACSDAALFDHQNSIPKTLNRISGMAKGWAHHYAFCNDQATVLAIDARIAETYHAYLEKAQNVAKSKKPKLSAAILGYRGALDVRPRAFEWPILACNDTTSTTVANTAP